MICLNDKGYNKPCYTGVLKILGSADCCILALITKTGEFPHKKKLYDLLDCIADYVASWTRCDDAHSAQQMKDIFPLLVRCKIILKMKGE